MTAGRSAGPTEQCTHAFRVMRWVAAFALALVVLLGYEFLADWNLSRFGSGIAPMMLWTALDRRLPTIPWFVWPYAFYYVLVMLPVFLARRPSQLVEMIAAYFLVSVVAWLVYVAFPVRMDYPELLCDGISCKVLEGLYRVDGGVNVMPSLHAAHSVLAAAIFFTYRSRLAWPVALAAMAVCVAAVLTRQHYILDVPPGILLGLVGWVVVRWIGNAARRLRPAPTTMP